MKQKETKVYELKQPIIKENPDSKPTKIKLDIKLGGKFSAFLDSE